MGNPGPELRVQNPSTWSCIRQVSTASNRPFGFRHGGNLVEVILRSEKDLRRVQLWRVAQLLPMRMVRMYIRDLGVFSKIIHPSIPDYVLYELNITKRRARS